MNTLSMPRNMRCLGTALSLLCVTVAHAETSTGHLDISATIHTSCSVSASAMAFGVVVPGTDRDTEAVVSVLCTSGTAYTLDVGDGLYQISTGGSTDNLYRRQMGSAAERLPYVLYQEAGRITEIAASVTNNNFVTTTLGNGSTQSYTLYGRVVGTESSTTPPGSYSDTVIITVEF